MDAKTVPKTRVSSYYLTRNCNDYTDQNLLAAASPTVSGEKLGSTHQGQGETPTSPWLKQEPLNAAVRVDAINVL